MSCSCGARSSSDTQHKRFADQPGGQQPSRYKVGLISDPNGGKTTIMNALTGSHQRVGNWSGVTVECKSGYFTAPHGQIIEIIDLPGVYSLSLTPEQAAQDEQITYDFVLSGQADCYINVVAAHNLERHLYLTIQLIELGVPCIIALNMMDIAASRQINIDIAALSQWLSRPIVALTARKGQGIAQLKQVLVDYCCQEATTQQLPTQIDAIYSPDCEQAIQTVHHALAAHLPIIAQSRGVQTQVGWEAKACGVKSSESIAPVLPARWLAIRALEGESEIQRNLPAACLQIVHEQQSALRQHCQEDADILLADARYRFIEQVLEYCVRRGRHLKKTWTDRLDRLLLNRFLGIPCFLGLIYLLFVCSINIGGIFQDFFDIGSDTLFVKGVAQGLTALHAQDWLVVLLSHGIGKGINTVLTFVPVLFCLFFFLALLEDSGYMMRAVFVVDRLMYRLGLPGKAFVPMIVGFGCNVPAILAARMLENKRDRTLTIMMSPFMSCSARLAIYAVFTATFFQQNAHNIVFLLYLIGIGMALITGLILRKTVLRGQPQPLVMELPPYQWPCFSTLSRQAWQRLRVFLFDAGKLIIPLCMVISILNAIHTDGSLHLDGDGDISLLAVVGQALTPLFSPIGITMDNWPATVGLVTGILAKEVVIGTLNTLYMHVGHLAQFHPLPPWQELITGLQQAAHSVMDHLKAIMGAFTNPLWAHAPADVMADNITTIMRQRFGGSANAFAYLLFVLLYFPCVSTSAVIAKELHWGWALLSVLWMTGVAYSAALIFYQASLWSVQPLTSLAWIVGACAVFLGVLGLAKCYADYEERALAMNEEA